MAAAQYVNAFADAIGVPLDGDEERPTLVAPLYPPPSLEKVPAARQKLLTQITDFYGGELPNAFRYLVGRGTHLKATWDYVRGTLPDRVLSRPYKTMIGFAASVVTRSPYGINFYRRELLRLGAGEEGILEVLTHRAGLRGHHQGRRPALDAGRDRKQRHASRPCVADWETSARRGVTANSSPFQFPET